MPWPWVPDWIKKEKGERTLSTYTDLSLIADSMWLTASCPHHHAYSIMVDYIPSECESKQTVPWFTFVPARGEQLIQKIGIMSRVIRCDKPDHIVYRTIRGIWKHLEIQVTGALKCSKESVWGHPHSNSPVRMLREMQALEARSWGFRGK